MQKQIEKLDYSLSLGKIRQDGKNFFVLTNVENGDIICKEEKLEDLFSSRNEVLVDGFLVSQCSKDISSAASGEKCRVYDRVFDFLKEYFIQRVLGKKPDPEILIEELLREVILISARADLFWKLYNKRK